MENLYTPARRPAKLLKPEERKKFRRTDPRTRFSDPGFVLRIRNFRWQHFPARRLRSCARARARVCLCVRVRRSGLHSLADHTRVQIHFRLSPFPLPPSPSSYVVCAKREPNQKRAPINLAEEIGNGNSVGRASLLSLESCRLGSWFSSGELSSELS